MLRIGNVGENVEETKDLIVETLGELGIEEGDLTIDDGSLEVDGTATLYRGTPYWDGETLTLIEDDLEPAQVLEKLKEADPNLNVEGSLLFGDDDYRTYFWFESKPGATEVSVDFALGCDETFDQLGFPASECRFLHVSNSDWGPAVYGIRTSAELEEAREATREFVSFLEDSGIDVFEDENEENDYDELWNEFVEKRTGTDVLRDAGELGSFLIVERSLVLEMLEED